MFFTYVPQDPDQPVGTLVFTVGAIGSVSDSGCASALPNNTSQLVTSSITEFGQATAQFTISLQSTCSEEVEVIYQVTLLGYPQGVVPAATSQSARLTIAPRPQIGPFRLDIATGGTNPDKDDIIVSPSEAETVKTFFSNFGGASQADLVFNPTTGSTRTVTASPQDSSAVWKVRAQFGGQTSNTETVVIVPPQKFIQVLIGEAQAQLATNDLFSAKAVAMVIRNRVSPNNSWPDTYNAVITESGQFASVGTSRYNAARTRTTAESITAYDNALGVAADVFGGIEQHTLGGSIAFGSPGAVQAQRDIDTLLFIANIPDCPIDYRVDAKTLGFDTRWFPRFSAIDEQVILINEIPVETFVFIRPRNAPADCAVRKFSFHENF